MFIIFLASVMVLSTAFFLLLYYHQVKKLSKTPLNSDFSILINALNDIVFGGDGNLEIVSNREFFIRKEGSSQFVNFKYRFGFIYISLKLNIKGEVILFRRKFGYGNEVNMYNQLIIEKEILKEIADFRKRVVAGSKDSKYSFELAMH